MLGVPATCSSPTPTAKRWKSPKLASSAERTHFRRARELYNPGGFPPPDPNRPIPAGESLGHSFILGTPSQAAEQVAAMREIGVRNLMFKLNVGEMDTHRVQKSMRMLGDQVMPKFME